MLRYTIKRLIQGIITVWFIATATFVAMHAVPGDLARAEQGRHRADKENLEIKYGLNKPVTTQYLIYMGNMLHGDFGISFTRRTAASTTSSSNTFPFRQRSAFRHQRSAGVGCYGRIDGALPQQAAGHCDHVRRDPVYFDTELRVRRAGSIGAREDQRAGGAYAAPRCWLWAVSHDRPSLVLDSARWHF
jgi:hypothetical protein